MNTKIKADIEHIDAIEILIKSAIDDIKGNRKDTAIRKLTEADNIVDHIKKENSAWIPIDVAIIKLNCSKRTIWRMVNDRRISGKKYKNKMYIFESSINDYLENLKKEKEV